MTVYLTESELAQRWAVTKNALRQWRYRGEGPPYLKVGSRVRYRLSAVEAWEKEREVSARAVA